MPDAVELLLLLVRLLHDRNGRGRRRKVSLKLMRLELEVLLEEVVLVSWSMVVLLKLLLSQVEMMLRVALRLMRL